MDTGKSSTIIGMLLLLAAIGFILTLSANANRTNSGQAQGSPTPASSPASTPASTPASSPASTPHSSPPATIQITVIPAPSGTPDTSRFPTPDPTRVAWRQYVDHIFYRQEGVIIAQGTNATPIPHELLNVSLTTYQVEEVSLPNTITMKLRVPGPTRDRLEPRTVTFDKLWRITVFGGTFWVGNASWTIWIDDTLVGNGLEGRDRLTTIVVDRTLLREGATIGVGRGTRPTLLPERLHFNRAP
jgi:hypothetical protein